MEKKENIDFINNENPGLEDIEKIYKNFKNIETIYENVRYFAELTDCLIFNIFLNHQRLNDKLDQYKKYSRIFLYEKPPAKSLNSSFYD